MKRVAEQCGGVAVGGVQSCRDGVRAQRLGGRASCGNDHCGRGGELDGCAAVGTEGDCVEEQEGGGGRGGVENCAGAAIG